MSHDPRPICLRCETPQGADLAERSRLAEELSRLTRLYQGGERSPWLDVALADARQAYGASVPRLVDERGVHIPGGNSNGWCAHCWPLERAERLASRRPVRARRAS